MKRILGLLLLLMITGCQVSSKSDEQNQTENTTKIATAINVVEITKTPEGNKLNESNSPPSKIIDLDSSAVFYNLPQTTLIEKTGLYASPNRPELISQVEIQTGEIIYIMGRNSTNSHLRVVWNVGVGWIPTSFTEYNAQRDKMNSLPIFQREPPACAIPIITQFNLNNSWKLEGDKNQRVAVVIDLFRSKYGEFPSSYLSLTINGKPVDSSRRQIVEQGQFSLKDVVFSLPDYLQPGDELGYYLETSSDEPLVFLATIFSIPENCQWDID